MNDKPVEEPAQKSDESTLSSPESEAKSTGNTRTKGYFPSVNWLVAWLVMIGSVVFLHFAAEQIEDRIPFIDQAIRNLLTFLAMLGIPFTFFLWFSFFSANGTLLIRQLLFWGYIGLEVAIIMVLTIFVEFDGDLAPIGWKSEATIETKIVEGEVDLKTQTPDDFPQFLGPNRDGRLPGMYLAYDWEKEKPKLLWKQPIGQGHSAFATRNGFAVTMEQRGDLELTTCYKISNGDLMWTYGVETRHTTMLGKLGPRSTPTIYDGMVYTLGAHGHLACLDGSTGKAIWTKDLLAEFGTSIEQEKNTVKWGRSNSPLVFDDKIVIPAGGPPGGPYVSLVCYNRKTGEEIWRGGETQIGYSSPILMQYASSRGFVLSIVSVNESNVTAHDVTNGEIIWSHDRPGGSTSDANTSQPVILPGSNLLLTKGYGLGSERIQLQGGQLLSLWKNTAVLKTKFTNAVFYRAYAFALSDGRLECIDLRNGKRIWKSSKSYGHGQLLLCGSELLVLSEKGYVCLVRAWGSIEEESASRSHVQFTSFKAIDGTSWNTIAMHGNKLLVRNSKEAACYEMPVRYSKTN